MANPVEEFLQYAEYKNCEETDKMATTSLEDLKKVIDNRKDCILYGPPGTGKTYLLDHIVEAMGDKIGLVKRIQFHANYSYEEFIEGIIPDVSTGGFKYADGIFMTFCQDATKAEYKDKICIFVIDEFNRANVAAVFGEVLNLIEEKGTRSVETSKRHIDFSIPSNVIIIGTMNTADKSLAKIDFALRRRFSFLPLYPSEDILSQIISKCGFEEGMPISIEDYVACFKIINTRIAKHPLMGKELTLSHILWTRKNSSNAEYSVDDIYSVFTEVIFPQLESYCGSNSEALGSIIGNKIRDKLVFGSKITQQDVIDFLCSIKNSQVVKQ